MRGREQVVLVVVGAALALAAGCGSSGTDAARGLPDDATVTYAFFDASVPPPYHRSVRLTVTRSDARIVVDSYGDILADQSVPTPDSVWATLSATLSNVEELTEDDTDPGCTGGTGIRLTVSTPEATLLDLDPQFCAGSNEGLQGSIDAWVAPARDLFPATEVLAPEGP